MKIGFAGGGTGGHLFPSLAIADAIKQKQPTWQLYFCGTERGIEKTVVPKRGYELKTVSITPFKRGFSLKEIFHNLKIPFKLLNAFLQSRKILLEAPITNLVIGSGGYASFPIVFMAQRLGIKTVVQEQNVDFGFSNKLLVKRATHVYVAFEETLRKYKFKDDKFFVIGTPSRTKQSISRSETLSALGLDVKRKTLLVFGGSLGSKSINEVVFSWVNDILQKYNLIWQVGKYSFKEFSAKVGKRVCLSVSEFIDDMNKALQVADLAICRAGASTIAELKNYNLPSVLIPYPYASEDHQKNNAMALEKDHCAIMIENHKLVDSKQRIFELLENDLMLKKMRETLQKKSVPQATENIKEKIIKLVEN